MSAAPLPPGAEPLAADDRAACAVCADWLHTSPLVSAVGALAAAAALAGLATGGAPHPLALLVALGAVERYLAVRIALDARLFQRLSTGELTLSALDAGLHAVLGVPAAKAGRPLARRMAGARRLQRWHAATCLGLVLCAVLAWA